MTSRLVHYDGRVQGVGFRWTVKSLASGYDVTGSVRNLADGRVELIASGDSAEVEDFLRAVRESHLAGHIVGESTAEIPPPPLKGFHIIP
jgi:acylphosphatase